MADLIQRIRKALKGSTSQRPVDAINLYPLADRETVQAALLQMYEAREVMCCLITTRGKQRSVWWDTGTLVELPRYGQRAAVAVVRTKPKPEKRGSRGPKYSEFTVKLMQIIREQPGLTMAELVAITQENQKTNNALTRLQVIGCVCHEGKPRSYRYYPKDQA